MMTVQDGASQRTMTIKRGMTRLKTIDGQLRSITEKIQQYGAVSDKHKHMLGDTTLPNTPEGIKKNHEDARRVVESLYQQFHDLIEEYIKIKVAIDKANSETFIHVAGKRMSLREALMYKQRDGITHYMRGMVTAYNQSVAQAMRVVHTHNSQFNSIPEDSRTPFLADIESMVNRERIVELDEFLVKFTSEVDGELDDAIISTPIVIE
jgi:hypothetical protein